MSDKQPWFGGGSDLIKEMRKDEKGKESIGRMS